MSLYCLKTPKGELLSYTIAETKQSCWGLSFDHVAFALGEKWRECFWKRWEHSLTSARRNGYRIVEITIKERK